MLYDQKNWTIDMIQKMTEQDAISMDHEALSIKGHTIYFVNFGGYFGYSALVFSDGQHIYYANDYQMHHKKHDWTDGSDHVSDYSKNELKQMYIEKLNKILFTDDELISPLSDYDDFRLKNEYLFNYYGMKRSHISIFGNFNDTAYEAEYRKKTESMIYDPIAFAYYDPADRDFVEHHKMLYVELKKREKEMKDCNNLDYWKKAFLYEMFNHEYGINWQADFDTFSAFGNVKYLDDCSGGDGNIIDKYCDQLHFNDTQREAYYLAREEYFRTCGDI